jgi:hypothetical protein
MAQSTEDIYGRAKELTKNVEDNFLDLARTLRQLKNRDPALFTDLWKKTNLGRRKAYYMIEIDETYGQLPIPRSRLKKLGWTKLQIIRKHVNADNWEELFANAESMATKQLEKLMKGEQPVSNAHCVLMYMTPTQYNLFEETLLENGAARSGRGLLHKEDALTRVLKKAKKSKDQGSEQQTSL